MASIKTYPFPNSSILRVNSDRDLINTSPPYQRQGGIWTLEKKQLLIDSIINDYDIPKLYFHSLNEQQKIDIDNSFDYAIIDGRQRLEAIWEFIDGEFAISDDFEYQLDKNIHAEGLTYQDLAKEYPKIKIRFDSYTLPIILVETEDPDLIEDMFSRLNEAVPLNSAEKRNSFGGPMAKTIRDLAMHHFFLNYVKIANSRYQHREMSARLLFIEDSLVEHNRIIDTKKPYLDKMVFDYRDQNKPATRIYETAKEILDLMCSVFSPLDNLLRAQAIVTVYYLLFKVALKNNTVANLSRKNFIAFFETLASNRLIAEKNFTKAEYRYLEFDRLSQQGTNDASSIKERVIIMSEFLDLGAVDLK